MQAVGATNADRLHSHAACPTEVLRGIIAHVHRLAGRHVQLLQYRLERSRAGLPGPASEGVAVDDRREVVLQSEGSHLPLLNRQVTVRHQAEPQLPGEVFQQVPHFGIGRNPRIVPAVDLHHGGDPVVRPAAVALQPAIERVSADTLLEQLVKLGKRAIPRKGKLPLRPSGHGTHPAEHVFAFREQRIVKVKYYGLPIGHARSR